VVIVLVTGVTTIPVRVADKRVETCCGVIVAQLINETHIKIVKIAINFFIYFFTVKRKILFCIRTLSIRNIGQPIKAELIVAGNDGTPSSISLALMALLVKGNGISILDPTPQYATFI
jgi:hypothetical protein